ncbi:MAG: tetratricopeptide repeat protein [Fuerstiella sp.]
MNAPRVIEKLQDAVRKHQAGDVAAAAQLYAEVLTHDPSNADAWHLFGLVDYAQGDHEQAESAIRRAIGLKPREVEFKANLAAILVNQKRSEEAEDLCRQVLRINDAHPGALAHLGTALRQQKKLQQCLSTCQQAVAVRADATALCNLATVLADLGRIHEARDALLQARQLDPNRPQVHINLGTILRELGDVDEALRSFAAAEQLVPSSYEVHLNRGNLFQEAGNVFDAIEDYQRAIAIDPTQPSAVAGLGRALQKTGCWEECLEAHRLAAELAPNNQQYQSSYLYSATLSPLLSEDLVRQFHAAWGRKLEASIAPLAVHLNDLTTDRRLRIGYVSPDLRSHATMRFLYPLLQAHDRSAVELFFYSETVWEDDVTERVRELSDGWCATRGLSDPELAERIQQDRIDILVDLAGHTSENRLPVFARRPAPVQVSFLGYPATTGLGRIDYYLTDEIRHPSDAVSGFTEQPYRLPHGACCYQAISAPPVAPPPCLKNGFLTFGSTHRLEKISPQSLKLWALVMAAVPDAKLLVFRDTLRSDSLREQFRRTLQESGINTGRVLFGWELPDAHLEVYSQIDVMLDVFPWGSGTVAYDAMWMGVPIPTMPGDRSGCRATASMMHYCGLPELVGASDDDYVAIVAELAADRDRLKKLRYTLREAMADTVCNASQFAQDVETAYRTMWQNYLHGAARQDRRYVLEH